MISPANSATIDDASGFLGFHASRQGIRNLAFKFFGFNYSGGFSHWSLIIF
jgi:hypothetical protein